MSPDELEYKSLELTVCTQKQMFKSNNKVIGQVNIMHQINKIYYIILGDRGACEI